MFGDVLEGEKYFEMIFGWYFEWEMIVIKWLFGFLVFLVVVILIVYFWFLLIVVIGLIIIISGLELIGVLVLVIVSVIFGVVWFF